MRHNRLSKPLAAAALFALAACSGAGITPPTGAVPIGTQVSANTARSASVEFVIHWKVAASARSVRVDVSQKGSPTIVKTTIADRPGHAASSDTHFDVPVGDDDFAFTVFDGPHGGGDALGGAVVTRTIRANASNTVKAAFTGYAAGFILHPVDSRMRIIYAGSIGPAPPIYDISGQAPLTFSVAVTDADGDILLAPGAPSVKAVSEITATFAVARVKGSANTFTVQAVGPMPRTTPHLVLEARGAGGTTYTTSYQLTETALLYASAGSGSTAHIYAFDSLGRSYPFSGAFPGLNRPIGLTLDENKARIYVADAGASKILAYDENGNPIAGWAAPVVPGITGIAFSPHAKHIYASTNAGNGAIDVFDTAGAPVSVPGAFGSLHAPPVGVAYDPQWQVVAVAESGTPGYVDVYGDTGVYLAAQSGVLTDFAGYPFVPVGISPALDGNGDFWVSGIDGFPSGTGSIAPQPTTALYWPQSVFDGYKLFAGQGLLTFGYADSAIDGIGPVLNVATDPADPAIFYIVQASAPMWGMYCGVSFINCFNSNLPTQIAPGHGGGPSVFPALDVPGYTGTIQQAGVTNFTDAVFTQY